MNDEQTLLACIEKSGLTPEEFGTLLYEATLRDGSDRCNIARIKLFTFEHGRSVYFTELESLYGVKT